MSSGFYLHTKNVNINIDAFRIYYLIYRYSFLDIEFHTNKFNLGGLWEDYLDAMYWNT